MEGVYVVSGARSAIGTFGGTLKNIPPSDLGTRVAGEALKRSGVESAKVSHAVFGQVIPTEPKDNYIVCVIGVNAGLAVETPVLTVNGLCGSGLQAMVSAAHGLMLGDCEFALAGGAESMSRAPFLAPSIRWGNRSGDNVFVDRLNGAL